MTNPNSSPPNSCTGRYQQGQSPLHTSPLVSRAIPQISLPERGWQAARHGEAAGNRVEPAAFKIGLAGGSVPAKSSSG